MRWMDNALLPETARSWHRGFVEQVWCLVTYLNSRDGDAVTAVSRRRGYDPKTRSDVAMACK